MFEILFTLVARLLANKAGWPIFNKSYSALQIDVFDRSYWNGL